MEFRILGPLEVVDGARRVALPRGRGRAVLALLLVHVGEVVSAERIIDELWGQSPPPTAATALQGLVSTLRKRLEPDRAAGELSEVLTTHPSGYALSIAREQVDAHRFRRLFEAAAGTPAAERAAQLRAALGLWRGEALIDFAYEPFAQAEIAALEELRQAAVEERIDADLALGRHGELVAELEGLATAYPFRERVRGQLMMALYRSGRQADALDVYARARRTLAEELGIEPGPALQRLELAILRQDPSLDLPQLSKSPGRIRGATGRASTGTARPWLPGARKTVTSVCVDLAESIGPDGPSDPEILAEAVGRCLEVATQAIERHGGEVEGFIGGVVVAVFGVPASREDDAVRAVRAAAELRRKLSRTNGELEQAQGVRLVARVGVSTGEVVLAASGPREGATSGNAVSVAARLQQAAAEGEVLVSGITRRLAGDVARWEPVERAPAGEGGQLAAWRLDRVVADGHAGGSRVDTPIVGRKAELTKLHAVFERTVREHQAELLTVVGEPGVGKSRLAREAGAGFAAVARVLTGRCPAYGEGIDFWPLWEVVLQASGAQDGGRAGKPSAVRDDGRSMAARGASALGLTRGSGRQEELFPSIRRFFEALARERPLVVILEDVHWARPSLLELVEYLAGSTREPVLLLCLARPEFLEGDAGGAADANNWPALFLEPLGADDSERLVADRLAGRVISPDAVARVVELAQGNPLFVEQLLAGLNDERELSIPPSIHALLAARLDRLGPAERDLLRSGAVLGTAFSVDALTALVPHEGRPFVGRHLQTLVAKQLLQPSREPFSRQPAFAFRHVLIRHAAYRSITRQVRAELHERFAEWLEGEPWVDEPDFAEIAGYHLEQAYDQRRQVGALDDNSSALAVRAGQLLATAGLRADARYDVAATANLLARAKSLLPPSHPRRRAVLHDLAQAYQVLGRHAEADDALEALLAETEAAQDRRVTQVVRLERARIRMFTGPDPTGLQSVREEAEQALVLFADPAEESGLALACYVLGLVHLRAGEMRDAELITRRGLVHADRSGRSREAMAARISFSWTVLAGATPVPQGVRVCEQLVPVLGFEHPIVLGDLAILQAMRGEFEEAGVLVDRARRLTLERMRGRPPLLLVAESAAHVALLSDEPDAAERELRLALELATDVGIRDRTSTLASRLSRVLASRGRLQEAEQLASRATRSAPAESLAAQAQWRAAQSLVRATRTGEERAQRPAREAPRLLPPEMLNLRADLQLNLAQVLSVTGQPEAAVRASGEAADLYERKGNLVGARRARVFPGDPPARGAPGNFAAPRNGPR